MSISEVGQSLPLGAAFYTRKGQPLFANDRFLEIMGIEKDGFSKEGESIRRRLMSASRENGKWAPFLTSDGTRRWLSIWRSSGDHFETIEIEDRSREQEEETHLKLLAQRDTLTGLLSRGEFLSQAENVLHGLHRRVRPGALVLFDIDQLGMLNERAGHEAGDRALQHFVSLLRSSSRASDILARLGGNEFAAFLPDTDEEGALIHAGKIVQAFAAPPDAGYLGVSAGVATLEMGQRKDLYRMMEEADWALFRAKNSGKGKAEVYAGAEVPDWPDRVYRALRENRVEIYAQETFGPHSHMEIFPFIREGDSLLPPELFLPEVSGLEARTGLDVWMLERAGQIAETFDKPVALWLSPFAHIADFETLQNIIVETSEAECLAHLREAALLFSRVDERGGKICIRNFGREAGPFSYLRYLPRGFIKIEKPVFAGLLGDQNERLVAQATLDLAARWSEGVTVTEINGGKEATMAENMGFARQGASLEPMERV